MTGIIIIPPDDDDDDGPDGEWLKEQGMAQAMSRRDIPPYAERFRALVESLPWGYQFTVDDIVSVVGLPEEVSQKRRNASVGAIMSGLARQKVITKTGRWVKTGRASSHARDVPVWQKS